MTKGKLKNSYRSLNDAAMSDWLWGDCLNNHIKTGYSIVRIDHDGAAAAGLSLDICGEDHYLVGHLFVSENGTDDKLQKGRTIGQVLLLNGCNSSTTDIYRRLGNCSNGQCNWSKWTQITDKEHLDELKESILNGGGLSSADTGSFLGRLQGTSELSDAAKDPFKFLGEYLTPNSEELQTALNNLHSTDKANGYEGVWRFTVQGKPSVLYNFAMNYPQDKWLQGLITIYSPTGNSSAPFTINNKLNILYRTLTAGEWSPWTNIVQQQNDVPDVAALVDKAVRKHNFVQVAGDDAYVISKYNATTDIIVHFAKTLANELYTVKRVYLAENRSDELSTDYTRAALVTLCRQDSSDMIGPLTVRTDGTADGTSWIGSNHLYLNQQSGIKSAKTDSFAIYADGRPLTSGGHYADEVTVNVVNTIFDPNVAPSDGDTILSSPLIKESVTYSVNNGEVVVSVEHRYLKDIYVSTYYGMQSMFTSGTQFITGGGGYSTWQDNPTSGGVNIVKSAAPGLNRFSQKNANGYYQNTVLLPCGLGKHNMINDADDIFKWSGGKLYHVLIRKRDIASGTVLSWMGVYNWNEPIVDDVDNYIYTYNDNTTGYLSVTAKKAYDNVAVTLPAKMLNCSVTLLDGTGEIALKELVGSNLLLTATAAGSAVAAPTALCDNSVTAHKLSADVRERVYNPLRALFIAAGAEYNDTDAVQIRKVKFDTSETVEHLPHCYCLNGLGDISEEEMLKIYNVGCFYGGVYGALSGIASRTNLGRSGPPNFSVDSPSLAYASKCTTISLCIPTVGYESTFYVKSNNYFSDATNLRVIYGRLLMENSYSNTFNNCVSLERVRIRTSVSVSLGSSPLINKKSLLYAIENATPAAAITITLHPDAYARLANDADIVAALEAQPLVSLVSA